MSPLLVALAGAAFVAGIIGIVLYFRPAPPKTGPRKPSLKSRWQRISKKTKQNLITGLVIGLIVAVLFGLPIMVVVVPALFVLLPMMLGKPSTRERDLILALETWARTLASASEHGSYTLKDVIGISRGSAPAILQKHVERLHARMSTVFSASQALRAFADELDNAYADEVTIYLIQAAEYHSGGLTKALTSVAENLAQQAKQKIELQRQLAKPRETKITMVLITGILIVILILFASFGPMNFYRTPLGNVALMIVISIDVLLLAWSQAVTRVIPEPRILVRAASPEVTR